jgi:hypothetical protein
MVTTTAVEMTCLRFIGTKFQGKRVGREAQLDV